MFLFGVIRESTRKSASHRCKEERWDSHRTIWFSRSPFSTHISVIFLMNRAKSKYNNPRKIYGRAPVNSFNDFSNESDQSTERWLQLCFLHCTERGWPEETSSTHFWLVTAALQRLASWLCGDTHQDWCVFLTNSLDGTFIWRDAAWQCEGKSHLAEQFPHTAWSFRFILPAEIIFREIASRSNYSVLYLIVTQIQRDNTIRGEGKICPFELINSIINNNSLWKL